MGVRWGKADGEYGRDDSAGGSFGGGVLGEVVEIGR